MNYFERLLPAAEPEVSGWSSGGKGGSQASSSPTEAPNTLQSTSVAKFVDLLGEGEIGGLVAGTQSIFVDKNAVGNSDGTTNYSGFKYQFMAGTSDQSYMPGFDDVASEFSVNLRATESQAATYTTNSNDLNAIVVTLQLPALSQVDKKTGNVNGSDVSIAVDILNLSHPGNGWVTKVTDHIAGKCTQPYERSYRIALDNDTQSQYSVRMRRLTADSTDVTLSNRTIFSHITEVIEKKVMYSDSAVVGVEIDATQFGVNIPERAYEVYGLKMRYPSNYDPETRTYTGFWDGSWSYGYQNNPAWVFMMLATHPRFGAGISDQYIDKWGLYQVAKYCDEQISDGQGGMEPRFVYNGVIANREDAYKVLQATAGMMRAIVFYAAGAVMVRQDGPVSESELKQFTKANIIGDFNYSSTAKDARHTIAQVQWINPALGYTQDYVAFEDREAIDRYGFNPLSIIAYGTTSRGQAYRIGKWAIATDLMNTDTVQFKAGWDAQELLPGDVIEIADNHWAKADFGGRVLQFVDASHIKLDRVISQDDHGHTVLVGESELHLTLSGGPIDDMDGVTEQMNADRPIQRRLNYFSAGVVAFDNVTNIATLDTPIPADMLDGMSDVPAIWIFSRETVKPRLFKVFTVVPDDETKGQVSVAALNYEPQKFEIVDSDFNIEIDPDHPTDLPKTNFCVPPSDLKLAYESVVKNGKLAMSISASWQASDDYYLQGYVVSYKKDNNNIVTLPVLADTTVTVTDTPLGVYQFTVRAINKLGTQSSPITAILDLNNLTSNGKSLITGLSGERNDGTFTGRDVKIKWDAKPLTKLLSTKNVSVDVRKAGSSTADGTVTVDTTGAQPVLNFGGNFSANTTVTVRISENEYSVVGDGSGAAGMATKVAAAIAEDARYDSTVSSGTQLTVGFSTDTSAATDLSASNDPLFLNYVVKVFDADGTLLRTENTTDNKYTYSYELNQKDHSNVAKRSIRFDVALQDTSAQISNYASITLTNPPPTLLVLSVVVEFGSITLRFTAPTDPDYAGIAVWMNTSPGVSLTDAQRVWKDRGNPVISTKPNVTYYFKYAFYDDFGLDGANYSNEFSVKTPAINPADIVVNIPDAPTGLTLSSELIDGKPRLNANWNASTIDDLAGYELAVAEGTGTFIVFPTGSNKYSFDNVRSGITYKAKVRTVNKMGERSSYSAQVTHTVLTDTVPPAKPTLFTAQASFSAIVLSWLNPIDGDLDRVYVYRADPVGNDSTPPTTPGPQIATVFANASDSGGYTDSGLTTGVKKYYWIQAVDTSGNVSGYLGPVSAKTASIDISDITPGLTPVQQVNGLPAAVGVAAAWGGSSIIFDTVTKKLYKYVGTSPTGHFESVIADTGVDLTGVPITTAQADPNNPLVAGGATGKLLFSTNTGKMYRWGGSSWLDLVTSAPAIDGIVPIGKIPDMDANKITSGTIASQRLAGAVVASSFGTDVRPIERFSNPQSGWGTPTSGRVVYNISDGKLYRANGTSWSASTDGADISAGTIDKLRLADGLKVVEVLTTLPTGLTSADVGRQASLMPSGKLYRVVAGPPIAWSAVLDGGDLAVNSLQIASFASSIRPYEIFSNPQTGWGTATNGRVVLNQSDQKLYRGNGSVWTKAVDGADLIVNSIGAGIIQAGVISATEIAAGAVTASKLSVKGDNLLKDPNFEDTNAWQIAVYQQPANTYIGSGTPFSGTGGWYKESAAYLASVSFGVGGAITLWDGQSANSYGYNNTRMVVYARWDGTAASLPTQTTQVQGGKIYAVSATVRNSSNQNVVVGFDIYDNNVNYLTTISVTSSANSGTTHPIAQYTLPAGAAFARGLIYNQGTSILSGPATVGGIYLQQASSGELIVDGAITTQKMTANTINADRLIAGSITAGLIAADTITADKLKIGQRGISTVGLDFTGTGTTLSWGSASSYIIYINSSGVSSTQQITAGSTTYSNAFTYVYWTLGSSTLNVTTNYGTATASNCVLMASWYGGGNVTVNYGGTIIDGSRIVTGSITAGQIAARSLTADKIQAGAITSAEIAAGSILASRLVVTDTSNMVPDPQVLDPAAWFFQGSISDGGFLTTNDPVTATAYGSKGIWSCNAGHENYCNSNYIPIKNGDSLFVSARVIPPSGTTGGTGVAQLYLGLWDGGKNFITYINAGSTNSGGWQLISNVFQNLQYTNLAYVTIMFCSRSTNTGIAQFGQPIIRKMAGAEVIVDGSIIANKIAAGAVTASKLKISSRGVTTTGIDFTCTGSNTVSWTGGSLSYINDSGAYTSQAISAGSATGPYIYWTQGGSTFAGTATDSSASGNQDVVVMAVCYGTQLAVTYGGTIVDGSRIVTGSITAGQIAAGTITGDRIQVNTINASKLILAPNNLVSDPFFSDISPSAWLVHAEQGAFYAGLSTSGVGWTIDTSQFQAGDLAVSRSLLMYDQNAWNKNDRFAIYQTDWNTTVSDGLARLMKVKTNAYYNVGFVAYNNSNQWVNFCIDWFSGTASNIGTYVTTIAAGTAATRRSFQIQAPVGAVFGRIVIYNQGGPAYGGSAFTGFMRLSELTLREANSAEMYVDGTITAGKLVANSITATQIATGAITAATIAAGAVTTDKMTANTINGNVITGNTLTGDKIIAGTIQAAQIATGAITASKVGIGDNSNLVVDAEVLDPASWFFQGSITDGAFLTTNDPATANQWGSKGVWSCNAGHENYCNSTYIPIKNGDSIFVSAKVIPPAGTTGGSGNAEVYVGFWNISKSYLSYVQVGGTSAGGWQLISNTFQNIQVPNVAYVTIMFCSRSYNTGIAQFGQPIIRRMNGGELIVDGSITAAKITTAKLIADDVLVTNSLSVDRLRSNTSLPATFSIGNTGYTLGSVVTAASADPATTINANTTLIQPGKILLSGGVTLSSWRNGADNTKIEGGSIAANTITANTLRIGNRGISTDGIEFYTTTATNTVTWTGGNILYTNNAGNFTYVAVSGGSVQWTGNTIFLYWSQGSGSIGVGTDYAITSNPDYVVLATYTGAGRVFVTYGGTIIDGAHIVTGSIDATRLNVTNLGAINANLGTVTAGIVTNSSYTFGVNANLSAIVTFAGSIMKVTGTNFGVSSNLIEWFGTAPSGANVLDPKLSQLSRANSRWTMENDGKVYYGGQEPGTGGGGGAGVKMVTGQINIYNGNGTFMPATNITCATAGYIDVTFDLPSYVTLAGTGSYTFYINNQSAGGGGFTSQGTEVVNGKPEIIFTSGSRVSVRKQVPSGSIPISILASVNVNGSYTSNEQFSVAIEYFPLIT